MAQRPGLAPRSATGRRLQARAPHRIRTPDTPGNPDLARTTAVGDRVSRPGRAAGSRPKRLRSDGERPAPLLTAATLTPFGALEPHVPPGRVRRATRRLSAEST